MRKLICAAVHGFNFIGGVLVLVKANQLELGWLFFWSGGALMTYAFALSVFLLKPSPAAICQPKPQPQPEPEIPTDYGHGYKARELANGKWVLWSEKANAACDLVSLGYTWSPGNRYFHHCISSRHKVDSIAKEVMAARGVFKS